MATVFTPVDNNQFAQGLSYYFGELPSPPAGWTAAQVGSFLDPTTKAVIGTWDTKNVTNMENAFNSGFGGQSARLNFNENISAWNTSSVLSMASMFAVCPSFNQPIGGWDVSSVTDMSGMFDNPGGPGSSPGIFNEDITSWNVAKVGSTEFMFRGSEAFAIDIRIWRIGATTNLNGMFFGATAFLSAYGGESGWGDLGQGTPTSAFFNYVAPIPNVLSFGGMPNKNPYVTNASFAMGRMLATRAHQSNPVPYKQFKTQNGGGTAGRLRRLKTQAAFGDVAKTVTTVVNVPGQPIQVTVTTTEPNFGGADPNIVNANLAKARNIGAAVPRNAIPR